MNIVCLDLEGVLIPEIWIAFAEKTGIEALKRTTRDEPCYDTLMRYRLDILDKEGFKLADIEEVIGTLDPLPGATEFVEWVTAQTRLVILSDTFSQFAGPLMAKLGNPTLFCHDLIIDDSGRIADYKQEECRQANAPTPVMMGIQMLGPMLMHFGTPSQKERFLPGIISGENVWCQGYSEPGSGSDLASLKTTADHDGDE